MSYSTNLSFCINRIKNLIIDQREMVPICPPNFQSFSGKTLPILAKNPLATFPPFGQSPVFSHIFPPIEFPDDHTFYSSDKMLGATDPRTRKKKKKGKRRKEELVGRGEHKSPRLGVEEGKNRPAEIGPDNKNSGKRGQFF
jgi:hypothetical protein